GYNQGVLGFGGLTGNGGGSSITPLNTEVQQVALGKGYAVATSSLNWFSTACNEVLSAEAALMIKQRFTETYGVPDWTMGYGGSGGSIQTLQIAADYPGLLNGILPLQTFPHS